MVCYTVAGQELNIDEYEVLRYLGYKRELIRDEDISLASKYIENARKYFFPKACYERFRVKVYDDNKIDMPYGTIISESLYRNLNGCGEIYIFAATIGIQFDRLMYRARATSMSDAAIYQAVGAAAAEAFCDMLNAKLEKLAQEEDKKLRPRFSPGYGDLNLDNQKGVFSVLEPHRYAGITLNDSLLMSPEKSVTAIIGIE